MKKRMLSALLAASMVLTMVPAAFAADTVEDIPWSGEGTYKLSEEATLKSVYTIEADTNTVYTIDVDTYTLKVDTLNVGQNSGLIINSSNADKGGSVQASNADGKITFHVDGSLELGPNVTFSSPIEIYKLTPDTATVKSVMPMNRAAMNQEDNGKVVIKGGTYTEPVTIGENLEAVVPEDAAVDGQIVVENGATLNVDGNVKTISVQAGASVVINGKVEVLELPADMNDADITIDADAEIGSTQTGNISSIFVAVYPSGGNHGTVEIYSLDGDTRYNATDMGTLDGTDPVGNLYSVRADAGAKLVAKVTPETGYQAKYVVFQPGNLAGWGEFNTMEAVGDNTFVEDMPMENVALTVQYEKIGGSSGGSGGSSGGGGGTATGTYSVSVATAQNGTVSVSPKNASKGATVTVTVTPDKGYELSSLTVTDQNGKAVTLTEAGNGKYTFKMPDSRVTVKATFTEIGEQPAELPFGDVASSAWYAEAVRYVYENGMMNGVSANSFGPNATTNRAMIVTILYRLEDTPAASSSGFTDVVSGSYYADAVNWAAANGIVNGVSATSFAPNTAVTREQMAAILYRYAQFKGYSVTASNSLNSYADASQLSSYAIAAMQWANAEGLITGSTSTTLNPVGNATRAEVATILMRFCENIAK
ncbi:S-layer homology domain-containing protein [Agathobaculum sp. Marseille-P7918]|uniref:S-layer homology domain-containing protein n=1 Tax=Agathobaculum sp. Marseille-P7918 TaxID=2479843 RepID=UPI003562CBA5